MKKYLFFALSYLFSSCGYTAIVSVKFEKKQNDVFTKQTLTDYLNKINTPEIILRVPDNVQTVLQQNNQDKDVASSYYYIIEKELIKSGFIVRDRALYAEVLKENKTLDYAEIGRVTKTNLILELVDISYPVFRTNIYTNPRGVEKVWTDGYIERKGLRIEYKIILVEENDFAGAYEFIYTPCSSEEGCKYVLEVLSWFQNSRKIFKPYQQRDAVKGFQAVSSDVVEYFFKSSIQQLVREIKPK